MHRHHITTFLVCHEGFRSLARCNVPILLVEAVMGGSKPPVPNRLWEKGVRIDKPCFAQQV